MSEDAWRHPSELTSADMHAGNGLAVCIQVSRDGVRTFRRQDVSTTDLDVCVVVICRFNTVLRVRVILSAGDVDCSFLASFSFRWLWFLVIWNSGQLVGMDCSFPASCAFPTLVPRRLVQRSIHPCSSAVQSSTGWPLRAKPSLLKAHRAPAERCDQFQGQWVTTMSTWVSLYRAAFRLKITSGAFSELDLKNLSRSVSKLLAFYGRASVASAINANICTGFMVILTIRHSRIFIGETSKGCRRNVCTSRGRRSPRRRLGLRVESELNGVCPHPV